MAQGALALGAAPPTAVGRVGVSHSCLLGKSQRLAREKNHSAGRLPASLSCVRVTRPPQGTPRAGPVSLEAWPAPGDEHFRLAGEEASTSLRYFSARPAHTWGSGVLPMDHSWFPVFHDYKSPCGEQRWCASLCKRAGFPLARFSPPLLGPKHPRGQLVSCAFTRSVPGGSEFGAQDSSLGCGGASVAPGIGEV